MVPGQRRPSRSTCASRWKAAAGSCPKFKSTRAGVPDRVVVRNGHTLFVEFKAPRGRPSVLQRVQIGRLRKAGADVRVIDSLAKVDALLAEFMLHTHSPQHRKAG